VSRASLPSNGETGNGEMGDGETSRSACDRNGAGNPGGGDASPSQDAARGSHEAGHGVARSASIAILLSGVVIASAFFFKNAWVDEDAYITFRSIEQWFAGNGLRWNPHERVQVFTHPLWLLLLSFFRLFTSDVFVVALTASFACLLALLAGAWRLLASAPRWAALLVLLISSKSFFDFTSSGLENPLAYALLALFFLFFSQILQPSTIDSPDRAGARHLAAVSGVLALLLLTRHDLLTLVLPAFGVALWRLRGLGAARLATASSLGLSPFLLWTLFSLFYYGFPFPNTAYAKLATGISNERLWGQGVHYLESGLRDDPLALGVIAVALVLGLYERSARSLAIAAGLVLNLFYVVEIGGDYMTGRFLASPFLVAALFVVGGRWVEAAATDRASGPGLGLGFGLGLGNGPARQLALGAGFALALYSLFLPGSPVRSGAGYSGEAPNEYGVGDQRGIFFDTTSIHRWWARPDRAAPFPDYRWTREGLAFAASDQRVRVRANVGFMGYWAGREKILIDRLGLTDPLLARLPSQPIWRIGHFPRKIPARYPETVERDVVESMVEDMVEGAIERRTRSASLIEDPGIRAYHERLRIITQAPLFSAERIEIIVRMNLGQYEHLLTAGAGPRAER